MITRTNSFLLFWEGEETLGRMHLSSNTSQICSNNSDSMRLDPWTVEQSVLDLVTLPLPCLWVLINSIKSFYLLYVCYLLESFKSIEVWKVLWICHLCSQEDQYENHVLKGVKKMDGLVEMSHKGPSSIISFNPQIKHNDIYIIMSHELPPHQTC